MIVHVIRSSRQIKRGFRGTSHLQIFSLGDRLAVTDHFHTALGTQSSLYAFLVFSLTSDGKQVTLDIDFVLQRSIVAHRESQSSGFVGLQAHHNHAVRERGKHPAGISHAIHLVTGGSRGILYVQIAVKVRSLFMSREIQEKTSHSQITHTVLACQEIGINQSLGFACLSLKYQIPHHWQDVQRVRVIIVVRATCPERLFVQLQFFASRAAIHHSSQSGITHGQSLRPILSRLAVPEFQFSGPCHTHPEQEQYSQ